MSRSGVNMAVTSDGSAYNKLRRPDTFAPPPTKSSPQAPSHVAPSKRKYDDNDVDNDGYYDDLSTGRQREKRFKNTITPSQPFSADPRRVVRPVRENGMQTMFPGLDSEEGSEDETMQEALAYLRSVRSEASTIPTLLIAEHKTSEEEEDRSMYDDGRGDTRAWYNDGTWVAIDDAEDSDQTDDIDPQDSYYKALLSRHKKLQHQLANADPSQLAARIQANPYIHVDTSLPGRRYDWLDTFENEYPTPARVHGISEINLFWALEFAGESLDHYDTISKQKSCWIWTLLALAGDRGTLDFTKIGRIRTLGRRAGQLGVRLREGARSSPPGESEDEEVEDWVVDGHGTDGEDDEPDPEETLTAPPTQNSQGKPTNHVLRPDGVNDESADASSDEGEVREDSSDEGEVREESNNTEAASLEAARARLLAQLGDRLIQPSVPPSPGALRHKHNGKPCHDPKCDTLKQLVEANAKNTSSQQHQQQKTAASPAPSKRVFASRAEAEEQRQMLRENELKQQKSQGPNEAASNPSLSLNKTQVLPRDIKEHAASSADVKHVDDHDKEEKEEEADPIDLNTRVTIDMILTVVAECYGQKDLLRYREVW